MKFLLLTLDEIGSFTRHLATYLPSAITSAPRFPSGAYFIGLDKLADPAFCLQGVQKMKLSVSPAELRERIFSKSEDKIVLAGVRFKSANKDFPYIKIHVNFPISSEELKDIIPSLQKEFAAITPKGVQLNAAPRQVFHLGEKIWDHIIFGEIAKLKQFPLPSHITTKVENDSSFYPCYRNEFQHWQQKHAELSLSIRCSDEGDFAASIAQEALFSVYDAQGWAGLIAGEPRYCFGLESLCIHEVFLSARLRGQGLAKAVQSYYLEQMKDKHKYVWGFINDKNPSSLNTARALGREAIQTEYFFPI